MNHLEIIQCDDFTSGISAISSMGGIQEALGEYDCLVLPSPYKGEEYFYAQETIDFIKFCRESTSDFSIGILSDKGIEIRSLHSFDIFMPIIWIATELLFPLAVNLVSDYIYDKMRGREHEEANVELSFVVERDNERKMLNYKGPASEFKKEFEKINLSKL